MEKCCICYEEYKGYGNNALPLSEGRCCDKCNKLVIDARFDKMKTIESVKRTIRGRDSEIKDIIRNIISVALGVRDNTDFDDDPVEAFRKLCEVDSSDLDNYDLFGLILEFV